jgi:ribonuclease P protein component
MTSGMSYPKSARLLRRGAFTRLLRAGEVHPGREALVRRAPNRSGRARLGLATPRGYGKAVVRNRFRRLAREAFRLVQDRLGAYDYLMSPRRHLAEPTLAGLQADLLRTLTETPAKPRPKKRRGT